MINRISDEADGGMVSVTVVCTLSVSGLSTPIISIYNLSRVEHAKTTKGMKKLSLLVSRLTFEKIYSLTVDSNPLHSGLPYLRTSTSNNVTTALNYQTIYFKICRMFS